MANYNTLLTTINTNIKANGNQEITGPVLNSVLTLMTNELGAGYQFMGVALPATNPGTPDQNVFYLAGPGVYPNFGNVRVNTGEIRAFKWNGAWDTTESLTVGSMDGYQFGGVVTPESSVPTSDAKLFFVACTEGEYNFVDGVGDRIEVAEGEVAIIYGQRPLWTKAVVAPHKFLTVDTSLDDLQTSISGSTFSGQFGHTVAEVEKAGLVRYETDGGGYEYYLVCGTDNQGEAPDKVIFINHNAVWVVSVAENDDITGINNYPIGIDAAPTENSTKPVSSGGVYTALAAKQDKDTNAVAGNVAVMDATGNSKGSNVPLDNVAKIDGQYDTLTSGYASNLIDKSDAGSEQQIMFRKTGGTTEVSASTRAMFKRLLGRTLVWNQLVGPSTSSVTIPNSHKYLSVISGTKSISTSDGAAISVTGGVDMVFDLTLMYGAGYEPASVAEFEAIYNKQYYPHNAGTFIHNVAQTYEAVSLNQWDEEWELGGFSPTTGEEATWNNRIRSKNYIPVISGANYFIKGGLFVFQYDSEKRFLSYIALSNTRYIFVAGCAFIRFSTNPVVMGVVTTYNHDICINLSNADINGTYAPYVKATATLGLSAFRVKDGQGNITTVNGVKGTGATYNEIDVENKTYIERVEMRAYQSGDDSDTSVLTDGTNTLAPLAEPVIYDLVDDMPTDCQTWGVGTENILPEGVDENGVPLTTPLRAVIYYPKDYTGIINNLPKSYISTASLTNMLNALKSARIIRSFTMTWNAETQTYNFTIS